MSLALIAFVFCHDEKSLQGVRLLGNSTVLLCKFSDVKIVCLFCFEGKSWQRALYHSIDGSRCLVALITNSYIKSAVCQEEFNLAMMKHYAMVSLYPILSSPIHII